MGKYYAAGTLFLVTANAETENAVVAAILKAGGISVLMELLLNGDREKVLVDRFDVRCQAALVLVNLVTESVETRAQVRGTYLSDVRMVMEATPNTSAARGPVEELYADLVATPAVCTLFFCFFAMGLFHSILFARFFHNLRCFNVPSCLGN